MSERTGNGRVDIELPMKGSTKSIPCVSNSQVSHFSVTVPCLLAFALNNCVSEILRSFAKRLREMLLIMFNIDTMLSKMVRTSAPCHPCGIYLQLLICHKTERDIAHMLLTVVDYQ